MIDAIGGFMGNLNRAIAVASLYHAIELLDDNVNFTLSNITRSNKGVLGGHIKLPLKAADYFVLGRAATYEMENEVKKNRPFIASRLAFFYQFEWDKLVFSQAEGVLTFYEKAGKNQQLSIELKINPYHAEIFTKHNMIDIRYFDHKLNDIGEIQSTISCLQEAV